jgi:hypothetical protein
MPCSVTNGRSLPCKSAVGGIKSVFFAPYTTTTRDLAVDSDGDVTLDDSVSFFQYHVKGNSSLETAINSSRENGTTFYESTLSLTLTFLDKATQEQIKLLAHSRPQVVVQDYNGNNFLVGKEHGVEVTGGTIVTGTGMAELSGFTLTMTSQETAPPFFCTAAPADDSSSAINPTP